MRQGGRYFRETLRHKPKLVERTTPNGEDDPVQEAHRQAYENHLAKRAAAENAATAEAGTVEENAS